MKRLLYAIFSLVFVSCIDGLNPWQNDPYNDFDQGGDYNQDGGDPEDTDPTVSDVDVDDDDTSDDNIANTNFDGTVSVVFSETDVSVTGSVEGVAFVKDGAHITFTNSGEGKVRYILSGSSSDGCFKLYSSRKQAIVLNGLTLTNTKGAAINNQSGKRTFIVVEGTNAIADGKVETVSGDYPEESDVEDMKAAFFSEGQLIFSGTGNLTVTAVGKSGITSDDYVRFFDGPTVTVTSSKGHGVRGKDAIIVSGGNVNVTLESTATGRKCFTTDSLIYIGGGVINLVNKASAGSIDSQVTGAAGIKADQVFVVRGGETTITSSGKGCKCISGDKNGFFEGGTVVAKATGANYGSTVSSKAIKFDGNLEFSGADVTVTCSAHEAIESKGTIYISGGNISATSSDDAINSASTMTISEGNVYAYSTGNDGLDSNGNLIIKGGTVFAIGKGSPEVGIDANTERGYKFYLESGTVIAISGIERGSSVGQKVISTSWNRNTSYTLEDSNGTLVSFKTPASGGSGLFISTPALVKGTSYTLKTANGGSTTVTASDYTSSDSNPGGPGRR